MDYPQNLHIDHSGYPLAPEKIKTKKEWLSLYSSKSANKFDIKTGIINRLTPNVMPKNNYIVNYKNTTYQKG